jgi:hypothetical protein
MFLIRIAEDRNFISSNQTKSQQAISIFKTLLT